MHKRLNITHQKISKLLPLIGIGEYYIVDTLSIRTNLLGHPLIGVIMVELEARVNGLDTQKLLQLEHIIASHHGAREFGAIVPLQTVKKVCHCEPVTDVTGVAIRRKVTEYAKIVLFHEGKRIPTPVCALARNDKERFFDKRKREHRYGAPAFVMLFSCYRFLPYSRAAQV